MVQQEESRDRSRQQMMTGLVGAAAACVLGATITALKTVLMPMAFAAMLAAVLWPPSTWLVKRGVPRMGALVIVSIIATLMVLFGANLLAQSAQGFINAVPEYSEQLNQEFNRVLESLAAYEVDLTALENSETIDPGSLLSTAGTLLSSVATTASNLLMIILLAMFLLAEGDGLARKAVKAFGPGPTSEHLLNVGASLQSYVMLKTITSGLTGLAVAFGLGVLGLPHATLWGFVAFLLNYIPNVGSIVAAIPAVLLALITGGLLQGSLVTGLYLLVNLLIGSILEPRLMGDTLGLSPLVVLLALLLWGWMWGASGMLLSVPLTVLLCEFLSINQATSWIADLLGPNPPPDDEPIAEE